MDTASRKGCSTVGSSSFSDRCAAGAGSLLTRSSDQCAAGAGLRAGGGSRSVPLGVGLQERGRGRRQPTGHGRDGGSGGGLCEWDR